MDRTAGADPGVLPGLHGCILGPDAYLAFRRAARADAAKDQTRRPCPRRPLRSTVSRIIADTVPTFELVKSAGSSHYIRSQMASLELCHSERANYQSTVVHSV